MAEVNAVCTNKAGKFAYLYTANFKRQQIPFPSSGNLCLSAIEERLWDVAGTQMANLERVQKEGTRTYRSFRPYLNIIRKINRIDEAKNESTKILHLSSRKWANINDNIYNDS